MSPHSRLEQPKQLQLPRQPSSTKSSLEQWHQDWCSISSVREGATVDESCERKKNGDASNNATSRTLDGLRSARLWIKQQAEAGTETDTDPKMNLESESKSKSLTLFRDKKRLDDFLRRFFSLSAPTSIETMHDENKNNEKIIDNDIDIDINNDVSSKRQVMLRHYQWMVVLSLELLVRCPTDAKDLFFQRFSKGYIKHYSKPEEMYTQTLQIGKNIEKPSRDQKRKRKRKKRHRRQTKKQQQSVRHNSITTSATDTIRSTRIIQSSEQETYYLEFLVEQLTAIAFALPSHQPFRFFLYETCLTSYMWKRIPKTVTYLLDSFEVQNPYLPSNIDLTLEDGKEKLRTKKVTKTKKKQRSSSKSQRPVEDSSLSNQEQQRQRRRSLLLSQKNKRGKMQHHHFNGMMTDVEKLLDSEPSTTTKRSIIHKKKKPIALTTKTKATTTTGAAAAAAASIPPFNAISSMKKDIQVNENTSKQVPIITPHYSTTIQNEKTIAQHEKMNDSQRDFDRHDSHVDHDILSTESPTKVTQITTTQTCCVFDSPKRLKQNYVVAETPIRKSRSSSSGSSSSSIYTDHNTMDRNTSRTVEETPSFSVIRRNPIRCTTTVSETPVSNQRKRSYTSFTLEETPLKMNLTAAEKEEEEEEEDMVTGRDKKRAISIAGTVAVRPMKLFGAVKKRPKNEDDDLMISSSSSSSCLATSTTLAMTGTSRPASMAVAAARSFLQRKAK